MNAPHWPRLLTTLLRGDDLTTDDTAWAMNQIMSGAATPAQIAAFVTALRAKGESPAEIAGLVEAMLAHATPVSLPEEIRADAVDVVGTGGDGSQSVNISTMAALVVAGTGVPVVKHGNRAASSASGAADLLEQLGVPLELGPEAVARCVTEAGIGFCFSRTFHPGMRHAGPVRSELGVPTAFNILGPLTNPARPAAGAVGCADPRLAPVMAQVFADRGQSVLLVRGEDGLDEFTTTAPTRVWITTGGEVRDTVVDAADLGLPRATTHCLRGGDPAHNADVLRRLLDGEVGPIRDAVLLNAAAALAARHGVDSDGDLHKALRAGLERAAEALDSGATAAVLTRWISVATTERQQPAAVAP